MKTKDLHFLIAAAFLVPSHAVASVISWNVSLDTAPLIANAAGPFSLEFQFTDGSGSGDGNNIVTISNFDAGGPVLGAPAIPFGSVSGSLSTTLTLTDASFFNEYIQQFSSTNAIRFTVSLTNQPDTGSVPDEFSFAILDRSGIEIPAQGPGDSLLSADIDSASPLLRSFASDTSRNTANGAPIALSAPIVRPAVVPEPLPASMLGAGLSLVIFWRSRLTRPARRPR